MEADSDELTVLDDMIWIMLVESPQDPLSCVPDRGALLCPRFPSASKASR